MTQRKYKLFVALVFTSSFAIGQGYKPEPKDIGRLVNENKKWGTPAANASFQYKYSLDSRPIKPVNINLSLATRQKETTSLTQHLPETAASTVAAQTDFTMVHPSSYYEQLGFFCRKEIQMQKITTVPVKFRLGSYDYVNWLEGKDKRP